MQQWRIGWLYVLFLTFVLERQVMRKGRDWGAQVEEGGSGEVAEGTSRGDLVSGKIVVATGIRKEWR